MASLLQTIVETGASFDLLPAERKVYSKAIELAAMPLLRFQQFAIEKEELVNQPGLSIRLSFWNDLPETIVSPTESHNRDRRLKEGTAMETDTLSMETIDIWVGEYGKAIAASRLTTRTAYVNWIKDSIPILARDYAKTVDNELRNYIFGMRGDGSGNGNDAGNEMVDWDRRPPGTGTIVDSIACNTEIFGQELQTYTFAANRGSLVGNNINNTYVLTAATIAKATEILALNNVPKLADGTWGCICHPHQLSQLKLDPKFREAVIQGSRGAEDIYTGIVGVYDGVTFFESSRTPRIVRPNLYGTGFNNLDPNAAAYGAVVFGAGAWARAVGCPVELVTDGVHDFGREIRIGWYSIFGQRYLAPYQVDRAVIIWTN